MPAGASRGGARESSCAHSACGAMRADCRPTPSRRGRRTSSLTAGFAVPEVPMSHDLGPVPRLALTREEAAASIGMSLDSFSVTYSRPCGSSAPAACGSSPSPNSRAGSTNTPSTPSPTGRQQHEAPRDPMHRFEPHDDDYAKSWMLSLIDESPDKLAFIAMPYAVTDAELDRQQDYFDRVYGFPRGRAATPRGQAAARHRRRQRESTARRHRSPRTPVGGWAGGASTDARTRARWRDCAPPVEEGTGEARSRSAPPAFPAVD